MRERPGANVGQSLFLLLLLRVCSANYCRAFSSLFVITHSFASSRHQQQQQQRMMHYHPARGASSKVRANESELSLFFLPFFLFFLFLWKSGARLGRHKRTFSRALANSKRRTRVRVCGAEAKAQYIANEENAVDDLLIYQAVSMRICVFKR